MHQRILTQCMTAWPNICAPQVSNGEAHGGAVGGRPPAEAAQLSRHAGPGALSAYLQHHQGPPACQAAGEPP